MPDRVFYAPMDSVALERYGVFKKMGFFGIDLASRAGAAQFLEYSNSILQYSQSSLWLTPEGRFVDPRDQTPPWQPGLAHLILGRGDIEVRPMAIEYSFVDEMKPLALCRMGSAIDRDEILSRSKSELSSMLQQRLQDEQRALANKVVTRCFDSFEVLESTRMRPTNVYDRMRWLAARMKGKPYQSRHGSFFQNA
jgi:1-acyl-sn-glycerol-3-phosphate acyltransferase